MRFTVLLLLAFLIFPCTCVRAQIVDGFEDGNLQNPEWLGDVANFVVADGRLRLMAPDAGVSRLYTDLSESTEVSGLSLEMLVEMDFSPSASNYTEIELQSCSGDDCTTNGTIRIGGISGSDDRVTVSLNADGESLELNGAAGAVGGQPALVRFVLERSGDLWTLETDYFGGSNFTQEDAGTLGGFSFNRFEIVCQYTATRADKFSFDDFAYATEVPMDTEPPLLSSGQVTDATTIELQYNEALDEAVSGNISNYQLTGTTVAVSAAVVTGSRVELQLDGPLPANQTVTLSIAQARDLSGNTAATESLELLFTLLNPPTVNNVILNEFLADPTPVIGLPDAEYVELFNPTDTAVDASLLAIASGGAAVGLPAGSVIPANGFLVITGSEVADFEALDATVAQINFPSLTNGGDEISVFAAGQLLVEIAYNDAWYNDPERDQGGYAIEYTGAGADAGCSASWKASEDASGGTPGRANSVIGRMVDNSPPLVTGLSVSQDQIEVFFNEDLDPDQFSDSGIFMLSNGGSILASDVLSDQTVTLSVSLETGVIYTLTIFPDYSDCAGNFPSEAVSFQLAIPSEPEAGDVIINEILFNPGSGGSDFVELFNCSDKVFQIEGWLLRNTLSESASSAERTISATRLFLPGEYLTLTADPEDLQARYFIVDSSLLVDQALPSLPDDEGNISIIAGGLVLDAFDYNEDLHSQLIGDEDGVSLERLRQKSSSQDDSNWFSGAQSENFATPTRANSQARDLLPAVIDQTFALVNPTFSPDGDGFEDILELQYLTDRPGFVARIRIFDAQGRPVRVLRSVELLAGQGVIRWDGANDEGRRARAGIYVLFVELFNPDGETREEKLTAVLAGGR